MSQKRGERPDGESFQEARNVFRSPRGHGADEFLRRLKEKTKPPPRPKRVGSRLRRVSGGRWSDQGPEEEKK